MNIAICGGTGFVGTALTHFFVQQQDSVVIITRKIPKDHQRHPQVTYVTWDQLHSDPQTLAGIDAIINLTGESINQRWTEAAKQRILESRLQAAARVANLVTALHPKPQVVINASGISIHGTSEVESFDETSPHHPTDFLAEVVEQWEQAADAIPVSRLVKLRVGLVLGNKGGAYPLMKLPYMLGGGGRVGNGRQWFSWIHIEDMVRLIDFCLRQEDVSGPVNATAPVPVRNDEFGRVLARVYHRPHWFPVPAVLLKGLFGELSILLLEGQQVLPNAALNHGFTFRYPTLESALQNLRSSSTY
ncbi:TIGR01777 family protein [Paenibacillus selenitireducens]|uniref:TIGR01777 family protein n=1 Tax=Paenibacillus selenitireducens TaxID=1324314 RepID=A0A1T2XAQ7_9BACL|nr:TIGR01777 family oxidoreductase [Paenibacillus selenitireducens]OPA76928.1 TIGR01777 family protein [Paenibacillus selenitireducens]